MSTLAERYESGTLTPGDKLLYALTVFQAEEQLLRKILAGEKKYKEANGIDFFREKALVARLDYVTKRIAHDVEFRSDMYKLELYHTELQNVGSETGPIGFMATIENVPPIVEPVHVRIGQKIAARIGDSDEAALSPVFDWPLAKEAQSPEVLHSDESFAEPAHSTPHDSPLEYSLPAAPEFPSACEPLELEEPSVSRKRRRAEISSEKVDVVDESAEGEEDQTEEGDEDAYEEEIVDEDTEEIEDADASSEDRSAEELEMEREDEDNGSETLDSAESRSEDSAPPVVVQEDETLDLYSMPALRAIGGEEEEEAPAQNPRRSTRQRKLVVVSKEDAVDRARMNDFAGVEAYYDYKIDSSATECGGPLKECRDAMTMLKIAAKTERLKIKKREHDRKETCFLCKTKKWCARQVSKNGVFVGPVGTTCIERLRYVIKACAEPKKLKLALENKLPFESSQSIIDESFDRLENNFCALLPDEYEEE